MEMPMFHQFQRETGSLSLLLSKHILTFLLPLLISIPFLTKWLNQYSSNFSKNLPPSPPKLPIIGNLHQLGSIPQRSLKSLAQKYGPVMLLQLGSKPALIISSADAAKEVLRKQDLSFADRPQPAFAGRLIYDFRDVAFSPYGEYWRQIRGICVSQLLSTKRVQSFRSIREDEIAKTLENIRASCLSGSVVCIGDILATLANNIVCKVSIGKRYSEEEKGSKFMELFLDSTEIGGYVNIADFIPWLGWINRINGMEAKVNKLQKEVDEYWESIVEEGMRRREKIQSEEHKGQQNFLDVLLQLHQENATGFTLDRDSIKALLMNMVLGGTDTTYTLLEWAFSELLKNPNAMINLQNEVRDQIPDCQSAAPIITEENLGKYPYLKAVVKETLRMHPPVGLFTRESREAVKILGYDIAARTEVYINVWAIGRDPLLWEDADEFRPERFLNRPPQDFEFFPFGSGRRVCPGSGFALATAELALANLIRTFNFALADGTKPEELDMTEAHGMVVPRKVPLLLVASLPN